MRIRYVCSRPCQENLPKSLQHNTLNKSRHRKERAQSLFMAELQCLSSKQQILLNSNRVPDEQKGEKRSELRGPDSYSIKSGGKKSSIFLH